MKHLYKTMRSFSVISTDDSTYLYASLDVKTDGELLYVILAPMYESTDTYTLGINVPVCYNGETKYFTEEVFSLELTVTFPYSDSVKSVEIPCKVYFNGAYSETGASLSWKGSINDPDPELSLKIGGVRQENSNVNYSWTITCPEGKYASIVNIRQVTYRVNYDGRWRDSYRYIAPQKLTGNSLSYYYPLDGGDIYILKLYAAIYNSEDDAVEDYIGLAEVTSRTIIVTASNQHYPPYDLTYKNPIAGAPLKISWTNPEDPGVKAGTMKFELERSLNGGDFTMIYTGESCIFTDSPDKTWEKVAYRVRSSSSSWLNASVYATGIPVSVIFSSVYVNYSSIIQPGLLNVGVDKKYYASKAFLGTVNDMVLIYRNNGGDYNIPDDLYMPLLYIESAGDVYVDTEFIPNENSAMNIVFSTSSETGAIAACDETWMSNGFGVYSKSLAFADSVAGGNQNFYDGNEHTIKINMNNDGQVYDGDSFIWSGTKTTFTTPCSLTLFCLNRNSNKQEYCPAKIYRCKLYDNSELINDLVPCQNKFSNEVGFYDLVNNKFFPTLQELPSYGYSVESIDGATYGFTLNSDEYYESQNKGIHSSYAICKLNITSDGIHNLYLDCINSGENNYDFGILSNVDTTLTLDYSVDSTNVFKSFKGLSSTSVQTVDYGILTEGEHYIYIKFRKDGSASSGNDSLQFKVRFE